MLTALVFSGLESKLHDGFNLISSYLAFLYRNVTSHNIVIYTMLSSPSAACASLPQVYVVDISCGVSGQATDTAPSQTHNAPSGGDKKHKQSEYTDSTG